ncbi:hypothetical protein EMIT0P4_70215 [Pseudomonas sp. IT-P4]
MTLWLPDPRKNVTGLRQKHCRFMSSNETDRLKAPSPTKPVALSHSIQAQVLTLAVSSVELTCPGESNTKTQGRPDDTNIQNTGRVDQ